MAENLPSAQWLSILGCSQEVLPDVAGHLLEWVCPELVWVPSLAIQFVIQELGVLGLSPQEQRVEYNLTGMFKA